jgi:hypothetical protein
LVKEIKSRLQEILTELCEWQDIDILEGAIAAYSDKTVHLIRRIPSTRSEDNRPLVPKPSVH